MPFPYAMLGTALPSPQLFLCATLRHSYSTQVVSARVPSGHDFSRAVSAVKRLRL